MKKLFPYTNLWKGTFDLSNLYFHNIFKLLLDKNKFLKKK